MTYDTERITDLSMPSRIDGKKEPLYKKQEPFFCKKCNKSWQPLRDAGDMADYLIGFPKFGCTKKICFNCKRKKNDKRNN